MANNKFEQMTINAMGKELDKFRIKGDLVKVWQKGVKLPCQAKLREITNNSSSCTVNLLPLSTFELDPEKPVLINFQKNNIDFFSETKFLEKNCLIYQLEISDKNFRVEKRDEPRFICFPSMEVYFVIEIPFPINDNREILSFYREKGEESEFLSSFRESVFKNKTPNRKDGFESLDLRVLDISAGGFACCCSDNEYEYFKVKENSKAGYLYINGQAYSVKVKKFIYEVDYLNPYAKAIAMKKIGIEIEKREELNECLTGLEFSQMLLTQDDKNFEVLQT